MTSTRRWSTLLLLAGTTLPALFTTVAAAQTEATPVRAFRSFTREAAGRGLPQSTVVALHEDAEGVIWIATMGGLAKVERGFVERLRPAENAPTAEPFNAFAARRLGGLYVAGTAGLFTWTGTQWIRAATPGTMIALAEDGRGRLYGITTSGVLYVREVDAEQWTAVPASEAFDFDALVVRSNGDVFAGGTRGVVRLDAGRIAESMCGAPSSRVRVLRIDAGGTIWAGGEDGRPRFCAGANVAWQQVDVPGWSGGRIRAMTIDRRQRVWIGGDRGQVAFGRADRAFTLWSPHKGIKDATVTSLVGDRTGGVWLGFNGAGLQQWVGESWSHRTFWMDPADTASMFAFSLTPRPRGGFLAAVFSRGILAWDGTQMRQYGRAEGIAEDVRFAIEPEPGIIWAGGRQAIFESTDGRRFRRVHTMPLGFVNGFFRAPDGEWWAATSNFGVLRRLKDRWVPHEALNRRLADQHVRHIVWRRNGDVWLALTTGVTVLQSESLELVPVDLPDSLTAAYAIVEVNGQEMWVAGAWGVAVGDGTQWRMITAADGLAGTTAYSIGQTPGGDMWVGGSEGIAQRTRDGVWRKFDVSNGLISEETNSHGLLVLPDGGVLFGTMSGLARYQEDSVAPPDPPLQLFWRGVIAAAQSGRIEVQAHDRRVHLEWVAPWPRSTEVEYQTRVPGVRDAWSDAQTQPELRLENLRAGRYIVEVQARLPGATNWTTPISATLDVQPLWWETRAAQVGAVIVVAAAVFGLVQWRTARLRRRAQELEEAVEDAMANMKVLRGLLPICAHCKKIRDDGGHWSRLEEYIGRNSEADFSHSLCPDCQQTHYPELTSD